jgi:hypothetical protein
VGVKPGVFGRDKGLLELFGHFGQRDENAAFLEKFPDFVAIVGIHRRDDRGMVVGQRSDLGQPFVDVKIDAQHGQHAGHGRHQPES